MKEIISVIIPVYNTERYLEKCVDSVLNQTYQNLQVILVDDGSTDLSAQICDSYTEKDNRVQVIHKKNGGLSSARNVGLDVAHGAFVTFLDSDDYLHETCYYSLYTALQGEHDAIACVNYRRVDENYNVYMRDDKHTVLEKTDSLEYMRELLLHTGDVSVCTKLFPRKLIQEKCFDEDKLNEDLLFMMDLIPDFKYVIYTGTVGYYYLVRGNSTSSGYGKAVIDMASNAVSINSNIQRNYVELTEEGHRFALFQNMAYLLLVPKEEQNLENSDYISALQYLKSNFWRNGFRNHFLTTKNKIVISMLLLFPKFVIKIYQRKNKI